MIIRTGDDILQAVGLSSFHRQALAAVRTLALPDCWIAAGFVRNHIWDRLHDYPAMTPLNDIDVVFHDPDRVDDAFDRQQEDRLQVLLPLPWSVKNQARMHIRNNDRVYDSTADALTHWTETATAVGVRLTEGDRLELLAPFGIDDLINGYVRPTPHMKSHNIQYYRKRMANKGWQKIWPALQVYQM